MYSYAIQKTRRPCRAHLTRALELEPLSAVNTGHLDISVTEGKLSSQLNSSICRQSAWIRWHYRHRIFITNCITTPYIRHLSAEYCKSCTLPTILKLYQGFGNCITRHRQTGGRPCGRAARTGWAEPSAGVFAEGGADSQADWQYPFFATTDDTDIS